MKKSAVITSIAAVIIILTSCKKPDSSSLPTPGKREILTSKKWVLSEMNTRSSGSVTPIPLSNCEKDDYLIFDSYINFKSDQGSCTAYPSAPQTDLGNWQTTDNFISINLYSNGSSNYYGTYIINELTETTLVFSDNYSSTVTQYTFKAQ